LEGRKNILDLTVQTQMGINLCWCAVGTVCAVFLDPASSWTQCLMASKTLGPEAGDCCAQVDNNPCDMEGYLLNDQVTPKIGSFVTAEIDNKYVKKAISYNDVITQIDAGLPLAYRLEECVNIGNSNQTFCLSHFVILSGYDSSNGKQLVQILDSAGGTVSLISYSDFIKDYQGYSVTHTFFTKSRSI
jgi:hypothetical protein